MSKTLEPIKYTFASFAYAKIHFYKKLSFQFFLFFGKKAPNTIVQGFFAFLSKIK